MTLLAFDTCFDGCSVCIAQRRTSGALERASAMERFETGHAERLVPMIGEVMERAGVAFSDIDEIAVTIGPGTFTGTRIGIAAARSFALATGARTGGYSSLAVMAEVARRDIAADLMAVVVDARRGEVYAQLFGRDGGRGPLSPPQLLAVSAAAMIGGSERIVFAGSAASAVAEAALAAGRPAEASLPHLLPDAVALAHIAAASAPSEEPLLPLYLRPPDARPQEGKAIARV